LILSAKPIPPTAMDSNQVHLSRIPEFRRSTFCFCERFELSVAVKRLERSAAVEPWNFAFEIS
jgi:hypothetical protein